MAVKPYPTNTLIFTIDETVLDEPMKLALKRSWTHIGDMLVRARPHDEAAGADPVSILHVMVKYGARPYWKAGDEADTNWSERMEQHLRATLRKVSANLVGFNRNQRREGKPELAISAIEFALDGGAFALEFLTDSNGEVPEECAAVATAVRSAVNRGDVGEPVRVRVPSTASYAAQAAAAAAALKAAEAAERAAAEDAEETGEGADTAPSFAEDEALAAEIAAEEDAGAVSPLEVAPLSAEEWEAAYGTPQVAFTVDYAVGEAVDADGASRQFFVATGAPADEAVSA